MTPVNTEIPKQCHALCDRENIHLFKKPALFWEFWEHWPKSGNFLQCHTGIIGEYTGTAFIFNKYYLRNEDRRWSNRRLSLQQCDPSDEMNGKSSYPTMWLTRLVERVAYDTNSREWPTTWSVERVANDAIDEISGMSSQQCNQKKVANNEISGESGQWCDQKSLDLEKTSFFMCEFSSGETTKIIITERECQDLWECWTRQSWKPWSIFGKNIFWKEEKKDGQKKVTALLSLDSIDPFLFVVSELILELLYHNKLPKTIIFLFC